MAKIVTINEHHKPVVPSSTRDVLTRKKGDTRIIDGIPAIEKIEIDLLAKKLTEALKNTEMNLYHKNKGVDFRKISVQIQKIETTFTAAIRHVDPDKLELVSTVITLGSLKGLCEHINNAYSIPKNLQVGFHTVKTEARMARARETDGNRK